MGPESFGHHHSQLVDEISEQIDRGHYISLLGPSGIGKKRILEEVRKSTESQFRYLSYDLEKYFNHGIEKFYRDILADIMEEFPWDDQSDPSLNFTDQLIEYTGEDILIVFLSFRILDHDYYHRFCKDCRRIYNERRAGNEKKVSKVRMIFSGSLSSSKGKYDHQSPLHNILEPIEVLPLDPEDADRLIKSQLKYHHGQAETVYEVTQGHPLLIFELCTFLNQNEMKDNKSVGGDILASAFLDKVLSPPHCYVRRKEDAHREITSHLLSIIDELRRSPEFFRVILNLLDGQKEIAPLTALVYDHLTITGCLAIDPKHEYTFSCSLYRVFFEKILTTYFKADFCLFHAAVPYIWNRAWEIYKDSHPHRKYKPAPKWFTAAKERHFEDLFRNVKRKLRQYNDIGKFRKTLGFLFSVAFNTPEWGIYKAAGDSLHEEEGFRKESHGRWLKDDSSERIASLIFESCRGRESMFDASRRWSTIPVLVSRNKTIVYVCRVNPGEWAWHEKMKFFIQDSLGIYLSLKAREKERREKEALSKELSLLGIRHSEDHYRHNMKPLFNAFKSLAEALNLSRFKIHEILEKDKILSTIQDDETWQESDKTRNLRDDPALKHALDNLDTNNDNEFFFDSQIRTCFFMRKMDSGARMVIELPLPYGRSPDDIKPRFSQILELLSHGLNNGWGAARFSTLTKVLSETASYLYVVDQHYNLMFCNQKLLTLISIEESTHPLRHKCFKIIENRAAKCNHCRMDEVLRSQKSLRLQQDAICKGGISKSQANYVPIKTSDGRKVMAVAVYHDDISLSELVLRAVETLQEKSTVKEAEAVIKETLKKFGFKRIFQFRRKSRDSQIFISQGYTGKINNLAKGHAFSRKRITIKTKDVDLLLGKVGCWHRKGFNTASSPVGILKDRLGKSFFTLKESTSNDVRAYDAKKSRPNLWITLPLLRSDGEATLFCVDMGYDDREFEKILTLERLQHLANFGQMAAKILESIETRQYLKTLQAMLSHGTNEPVSMLRIAMRLMGLEIDPEKRSHWAKVGEACAGLVQSQLGSIITLEKGEGQIKADDFHIGDLLQRQFELFEAYGKASKIKFELVVEPENLEFYTSRQLLLQILNNLVGNAIRHLQKLPEDHFNDLFMDGKHIRLSAKKEDGQLTILISDNGQGLPKEIHRYFQSGIQVDERIPIHGLGIGFSRQIAGMLGGSLTLLTREGAPGTKFKLSLPRYSS